MDRLLSRLLLGAIWVLATLSITACGGGEGADTAMAQPHQVTTDTLRFAQAATQASTEAAGSTLVVRAYANLAAGVGAMMTVRLDGTELGSVEVNSTQPADYSFAAPGLHAGSRIDVVYTNNTANTGGVDRNLYVTQLYTSDTSVVPGALNSTIDRGVGAAAFDGVDVVPGQIGIYWDGALRLQWPDANLTDEIIVRASGLPAGGISPQMMVRIDGHFLGTVAVTSTSPTDYRFTAPRFSTGSKVDVTFTNAGSADGIARTLNVHYLMAGTTVLKPTDASVKFDAGTGLAAWDGNDQTAGRTDLTSNGALRGLWPAPNMTDGLTLRVSGTLADDIGPIVKVLVDEVLIGTVEVRSAEPIDLSLPSLPIKAGQRIQVIPTNTGTVNGQLRSLNLAYAISGLTYLVPTVGVPGLDAPWPAANLVDSLNIRARADLADGVGAQLHLYVDGVMVGVQEVASTVFADYKFAVPTMTSGRRVDVVFANPASSAGTDRNLYIAYLTTGNTVMLPNAAGTTYDRGVGSAAFDGVDVLTGSGNLPWGGALRLQWPAPNITDAVTIRASGVTAGGVAPRLILWVDGVAVSAVDVTSATPSDYRMPSTVLKPGSKVAVTLANPGTANGVDRALTIQYLIAGNTVVTAASADTSSVPGTLSATWPVANLTETLSIRAYADLAGGVGALMIVQVDGVEIGRQEVRTTMPADYLFASPVLKPGSKVDVIFGNDGRVDGVDRNLYVVQFTNGTTAFVPKTSNSTIDRGEGLAAFDGLDVVPGGSGIYWPAALRIVWPEPNLTSQVTVRASAVSAGGVGASMLVRVDGFVVGIVEVNASVPTDYTFASPALAAGSKVDVAFINADTVNGVRRELKVDYLITGNTVLRSTDAGMTLDLGPGLAAFDGANVQAAQASLTSNGALRGTWPAINRTDTLTLRGTATLAANVGPVIEVFADNILLGRTEVRSTTPADITLSTFPLQPGQVVEVRATNLGKVGSETRSLALSYAISGKTYLLATNGALKAAWPAPNLTDTLNIRARSDLAGGIGAVMQVFVDGVKVGEQEAKTATYADYRFAVPPMTAGRKLDILFANPDAPAGEDRNLYVAYMTTGNTVLLPNAPGNTYDRGAGIYAFDGQYVIAGTGNMYWGGALRATWPAPNITETVTIRASATSAGGVGALMLLWVDGVAVSSVEVNSATPTDYIMPTTALKAGSKVAVIFSNRGTVNGVDRALNVQYLIAGSSFLSASSSGVTYSNGDLTGSWPAANITDTLVVRAYADVASGVGAMLQLRINGVIVATREITATTPTDYSFAVPKLNAGDKVEVVYTNDGPGRNLYVTYIQTQGQTLMAYGDNVVLDSGVGEAAVDGLNTSAGTSAIYAPGALRFTLGTLGSSTSSAAQQAASRLLQQATFGPTLTEIDRVTAMGTDAWINEQLAMPFSADMVAYVQSKFDASAANRPGGSGYTVNWVNQRFWKSAATAPDQLRRRMGFALHQILMISLADSNLYHQARAYAAYVDILNKNALGNYRNLLEDIALSPAMGIYLSHMRNRAEDSGAGRVPDENFAREVMQLFTIGLQELNADGTLKTDGNGNPIETYTNADVMALAKVFTGWSWALPDAQLTEYNFRWTTPDLSAAADQQIDLKPMKAYPGMHSTLEKRVFSGKPWATTIPAGQTAAADLKMALDTLFNHPNVGPFISRQLIQHLVSSNPSPGYVSRVAAVFNNNGKGVRGDLAAVAKAILTDSEAQNPPASSIGKLREPVLRISHWMRAMGATSLSNEYAVVYDLDVLGQHPLGAGSVFGYFRPGYVPPNTALSYANATAPEMQIVDESTTVQWLNVAARMADSGLGWNGTAMDVSGNLQPLVDLLSSGQTEAVIERLNLLLYAGRMGSALKQDIRDTLASLGTNTASANLNRAKLALLLSLSHPDYLVTH